MSCPLCIPINVLINLFSNSSTYAAIVGDIHIEWSWFLCFPDCSYVKTSSKLVKSSAVSWHDGRFSSDYLQSKTTSYIPSCFVVPPNSSRFQWFVLRKDRFGLIFGRLVMYRIENCNVFGKWKCKYLWNLGDYRKWNWMDFWLNFDESDECMWVDFF